MSGFVLRSHSLDAYWDAVVRGEAHPDASGLPVDQAETVQWFQRLSAPLPDPNRDRAWDDLRQRLSDQPPKEQSQMSHAIALAPPRMPERFLPDPRMSRQRAMAWISIAVLLAMLGALAYGILTRHDPSNPTLPAVQPTESDSPLVTPWPQFRGGVERTGYTSDPGPGADLNLRWSFTVDESLNSIMQSDGKVIAFGAEGGLYVLDGASGEQLWSLDLSPGTSTMQDRVWLPAVEEGVVYVTILGGVVVAIDLEWGEVLWQSALTDEVSGAPTVSDGILYAVTGGSDLHALDALTGAEQWSSRLPDRISAQYLSVVGNVLYYPGDSGSVNALDASGGTPLWKSEPISAHRVAAYRDGRLFVPTLDGTLATLDAGNGAILWRTAPLAGEALNPVVTDDAVVLAVARVSVQSLDPSSGEVRWSLETPQMDTQSPHAGGSTLYLNFAGNETYNAVDLQTGELLAAVDITGAGSTAAITGDLLYVSGVSGPVRAYGPRDEAAAIEVQGTVPAAGYVATPPSAPVTEANIQAPATGEIQTIAVMTISPSMVLSGEAPDGRYWALEPAGVHFFDRDGNELEFWPMKLGTGPGEFSPEYQGPGIAWGGSVAAWLDDGNAYLTDMGNHRIQVYDSDGNYLRSWGVEGTEDGQLLAPVAITRTPDGNLVVADIGRGDLQWFDKDGNFLKKLSGPAEDSPFAHPVSVAYDPDGNFWVLDHSLARLFKFDPDGTHLLTVGNSPGMNLGQFYEPAAIDVDDEGRVWVADQTNRRVQAFDQHGNALGAIDGCQTDLGCFRRPGIVIAGGNDYIYVGDYDINGVEPDRIYKFLITSMPDIPVVAAGTPAA